MPGIERHLVGRAVEHARIVPEDVLGAVAVVDVPVDDRDALGAVRRLRVARRDGGVVEEAEAHRPGRVRRGGRAGAWPRRRCDPCPPSPRRPPATAPPDARSAASRVPGDMLVSASIRTSPSRGAAAMIAWHVRLRWARATLRGSPRSACSRMRPEKRSFSSARVDGAHAVRPLGMSHRHLMSERGRVAKKEGRHVDTLPPAATAYGVDVRTFPR